MNSLPSQESHEQSALSFRFFWQLFAGMFPVLITLTVFLVMIPDATGETVYVDGDGNQGYTTIQEAVDDAENGTVIRVFAGTYLENVVVNKTLSIIGNGSKSTILSGERSGDVLRIIGDRVNVSGLAITDSGPGENGIFVSGEGSGITNVESFFNGVGIHLSTAVNVSIEDCNLSSNDFGLYLISSAHTIVENTTFSQNSVYGLYLFLGEENEFIDNRIGPDNLFGIYMSNTKNNTFEGNTITDNLHYGIYLTLSEANEFTHNDVTGHSMIGINVTNSNNNSFENNVVSGNLDGMNFMYNSQGNTVHQSTISGNFAYGIIVSESESYTVNATNNWWGHSSGPFHMDLNPDGKGDRVSNAVIFNPWTGQREIGTLYVDDDATEGGDGSLENPYKWIQDAVDIAIKGETIRIFQGTYREHVFIDKTLDVIGNGSKLTIINGSGIGDVVWILADDVTIGDLAIAGSGDRLTGLRADGSNLDIYNIDCYDNGAGIYLLNSRNSILRNNSCRSNDFGIYLLFSSENTI